ncbi:glycosyltransferase family 2 protein [Phaeocystidibacter luteus]|uniref:Glycosyltransferase family 2 protein n=1 Tax=Phaeocystidibacter luteus TaxID=911197 RepID=A0A6N6RME4_9FLAO|nr:glycosyltransferase family 2 protein [Phaeocystidibacter luteus]KAB2814725.1 glycosyltransferase family 2 protein [Phaeocystidibacter luteus]
MKPIALAILNWNGKSLLEKFLGKVIDDSPEGEVIVIDNASSDDSVSWIQQNHPEIRIIENNTNTGYAGGYNEGLKEIKHDFVVLLNSDVETTPGWLAPILTRFQSDDSIAAIQPKIRAYNDKEYFEYAGASGGFIDSLGYPFCRGRIFGHLEKDEGQYDEAMPVFWSTGACLAVRNSAYQECNGLDPMFFAHMEEIDLCWRFQRSGYTCWVEPKSCVYHVGGGTLDSLNSRKTYLNFRNNLVLLTKNLPRHKILPIIFSRLILDGLAGIQFLLQRKPKHTIAIVKGHFHYYGMFNKIMRERSGQFPWPLTGVYQRSIVRQVFLGGLKNFSQLAQSSFVRTKTVVDRK